MILRCLNVFANCSSSSRSVVSSGGRSYKGVEDALLLWLFALDPPPGCIGWPDDELDDARELLCVAAALVMGGDVTSPELDFEC